MAITTLQSRLLTSLLIPLMFCVLILYLIGGTYSLKSTPNDWLFWETFHGNFIYSKNICQKSAERKSPKKYFLFFFFFFFDIWPGTRTLALRLVSQHITYETTATFNLCLHSTNFALQIRVNRSLRLYKKLFLIFCLPSSGFYRSF